MPSYYNAISDAQALDHLLGAAHRTTDGRTMRLRPSSFVRILAAAPQHVNYLRDYRTGQWSPHFNDGSSELRIVLSEAA